MRRRGCRFDGCTARAEYQFDPNLGVAPPEVMSWCSEHVAYGLSLAFDLQRERGDRWISMNIEPVGIRPRKARVKA